MLKILESNIYPEEVSVTVLDTSSAMGLVKSAADSEISGFVSKLVTDQDKVYVHILALGAGEAYSANRNADFFPEQNLIEYHKTFETSPAHIFRNHVNKDPSIAIGKVIFSTYNKRMRRVELIAWISKDRGADVVERIERGEFPATSMACTTPYDVCSICGNKAHTRQEYCEHLSSELGRMYPDGRKVMALNSAPLKFFDMSVVIRPADVTSAVLQKVASASSPVVGSAEMAEVFGLTEKTASIAKLSELIKEVEGGSMVDSSDNLADIMAKVSDPGHETIPHLNRFQLGEVLQGMAHLGISPSIAFLADMIGHKLVGEDALGVGRVVESYIGANGLDKIPLHEGTSDKDNVNPGVISVLAPHVKSASLLPDYVTHRAVMYDGDTYIPGTNVGYIGNGPHIEETPSERWARMSSHPESHASGGLMSMIKTLVMIGGAALAAKWYITREIERKSRELAHAQQPGVKIVLVKSAQDYRVTYRLAKHAMALAISKV